MEFVLSVRAKLTSVLLGGVALAGCGSVEERPATAARRMPAMPTMRPAGDEARARVSEEESVATAQRLAAAGDMAGAARALNAVGESERRRERILEVGRALAEKDPRAAEAWALAWPAGSTLQATVLESAARAMARKNAEAAVEWALQPRDGVAGRVVRRAVAMDLAGTEPRRTVEQLLARPAAAERDEMLSAAAASWARRDANAAVAWARELPEELRRRMVTGVGFEIAQTHPDRALEVAELLPAGRERWLLTGAVAQTWVAKDPQAAFAWAKALPAGEARDAAYAGFDTGLGLPAKRRIAGAPNTRSGTSRTRGGTGAGALVRDGDLPSFELWLRGQPPTMSRDEAVLEYVRQRGAAEPRAIGQWLTTLPPGATRERATELYVEGVLAVSPREAAGFLRTLPRSEQTPEMLERTAKRLLITDPAAAEVWIQQSDLPEFRKQELLREGRR